MGEDISKYMEWLDNEWVEIVKYQLHIKPKSTIDEIVKATGLQRDIVTEIINRKH